MDLKHKVAALGLTAAMGMAYVFEGTFLKPYKDPVGVWTDCVGHTGKDVVPGKLNTAGQCDAKLLADLVEAAATVDRCITVPLTYGQRTALVDFAFNVGPGAKGVKDGLCTLKSGKQPQIRVLFNSKMYYPACLEFRKWGPLNLRGIVKRREAEVAKCFEN